MSMNTCQHSPHPAGEPGPRQLVQLYFRVARFPAGVALGMMTLCYAAAGPTLGLYFAGVAVLTIIGPLAVLAEGLHQKAQAAHGVGSWIGIDLGILRRWLAADALVSTIALVWLTTVFQAEVRLLCWVQAYLLLASYALALLSLAAALEQLGLGTTGGSALSTLAGLAWLSWPVWMAPWLTGPEREWWVARLVECHPLFALNGLLAETYPVPWTQHKLAYALTNIGDDIPYQLPGSIWVCVLVHVLSGALLLCLARLVHVRRG